MYVGSFGQCPEESVNFTNLTKCMNEYQGSALHACVNVYITWEHRLLPFIAQHVFNMCITIFEYLKLNPTLIDGTLQPSVSAIFEPP